ncbi:DUF6126 family protein [Streptomyces sp. NPDC047002]|uniref:DUF6126 family protein n=1 Tax=Streptomyces sp. NPDC047002 TaxID=3155475 RepID=UPI0034524AFF
MTRAGRTARKEKRRQEFDLERWKERGVLLRLFLYIGVTHLFAGFIWLLFYVGGHAHK